MCVALFALVVVGVVVIAGCFLCANTQIHEKTWFQWLENIRPWCVSRQLWWGHRIPAWFAYKAGESDDNVDKNSDANAKRWIVARDEVSLKTRVLFLIHSLSRHHHRRRRRE